ncbi:MAG: hypothetical protein BWY19_01165 [bacterium ADurb.Bin212]|nr:MAG: hypothetical protein BWY19_01165 [bacterium ADurb.Bin212]
MKNALVYCRVATQDNRYSSDALNRQEKVCLEYAEKHNIYVKNVFKEVGFVSADKREFIVSLTGYLRQNEIEIMLISEYNRISRNAGCLSHVIGLFDRAGIEIVSVKEGLPVDMFTIGIMNEMAKFDRNYRRRAAIESRKAKSNR